MTRMACFLCRISPSQHCSYCAGTGYINTDADINATEWEAPRFGSDEIICEDSDGEQYDEH
jgi:hypothetical protein